MKLLISSLLIRVYISLYKNAEIEFIQTKFKHKFPFVSNSVQFSGNTSHGSRMITSVEIWKSTFLNKNLLTLLSSLWSKWASYSLAKNGPQTQNCYRRFVSSPEKIFF
jgi:hypothetical protein